MKFNVTRTDGKGNSNNKYLVINIDEPYAKEIADRIELEERRKGTWEHGNKTMCEIMGISGKVKLEEEKQEKKEKQETSSMYWDMVHAPCGGFGGDDYEELHREQREREMYWR